MREVLADLERADLRGIDGLAFPLREEAEELVEVLLVGADGLRRHVAFVAEVVDEHLLVVHRRGRGRAFRVFFHCSLFNQRRFESA